MLLCMQASFFILRYSLALPGRKKMSKVSNFKGYASITLKLIKYNNNDNNNVTRRFMSQITNV